MSLGMQFAVPVKVDGRECLAVFDPGTSEQKSIRGTVISDSRPFLFGTTIPLAKPGSFVELVYQGAEHKYRIAKVSDSIAGPTYFLEKDHGSTNLFD